MRFLITIPLLALSAVFGYFYYEQYFLWRDCFNELGRYFDGETGVVYLEQSGLIWLSLTMLSLCAAVFFLRLLRR